MNFRDPRFSKTRSGYRIEWVAATCALAVTMATATFIIE
jgi:hypothetical protein